MHISVILSLAMVSLVLTVASTPFAGSTAMDNHGVINGFSKAVNSLKTLTYTMIQTERLDGKTHVDSSLVKIQRVPHYTYLKMSDGAEILWGVNMNNGNAYVHPNSFPYVTLELDPDGAIMRKDQHHGVENAGYDYFEQVLTRAATNAAKDFDSRFLYLGEINYMGKSCYKLVVIDPNFKYVPYTVAAGETVMSIAKKLWVNEYMIYLHNDLSSYTNLNEGQLIEVPNDYAKEITLYVDKATMLTLLLRVDDDKGLFEQYVYENLKLNPTFTADEFSKDNKNYHF